MDRIGRELDRELNRLGPPGRASAVARAWPLAVGDLIARNSWPARIARDGTLHVATGSAAWAFELTQLESTLVTRLREALGDEAPARLRFAPGPLPGAVETGTKDSAAASPSPGPEELELAAEIACSIGDEKLRKLVARAAAASLAKARSGRSL